MLTGRCACGEIAYRIKSAPFDAGYCHCEICRRPSGAPVLAYATVPYSDLVIETGEPARRRSSSFGERWFCSDCGAQTAMHVDHQPDTIDFTLATLDSPEAVSPGFHIWHSAKIGWFDTADDLPRHAKLRPDTPGL
ncbi:MAG: GFA family protein [Alphaproteobacteria bacterium]|nr:GFA family protein [Alphaproteobacteria bacterium]